MAELVVARPAEGGARGVVVVRLAEHAHAVRHGGRGARVPQRVPRRARLHDARPPCLLDESRPRLAVLVVVVRLQDEREGARPAEGEGQRQRVQGLRQREGIGSEGRRGGAPERASARRVGRLVLLEAKCEAGAARMRAARGPRPAAPAAALARRQLQPIVGELQDLQLEHARPRRALQRTNGSTS